MINIHRNNSYFEFEFSVYIFRLYFVLYLYHLCSHQQAWIQLKIWMSINTDVIWSDVMLTSYTSSLTKLSETEQCKYQARFPLSVSDNFVWQAAFKCSIFSPLSSIAPWVQSVSNSFKSSPAMDNRLELSTNDNILNKGTLELLSNLTQSLIY